nr:MAG TPA: hypothetical protein [Caudoviricetes sp.]
MFQRRFTRIELCRIYNFISAKPCLGAKFYIGRRPV